MNRVQLCDYMAKELNITRTTCDRYVSAFCSAVKAALRKGDDVSIVGFGKWEVRTRAKRKSYNPHLKKVVSLPATKVPAFKAGKSLKLAVNSAKK